MSPRSFVQAAGIRMAYRLEGPPAAPVVMLSHSVLTNLEMWDAVAAQLADSWRVLRYDIRGHGATDVTPPPYTLARLADDAAALLDALELRSAHFIGTSLGGMIGQQLGVRHPGRLRSLTLANTSPVQGAPAAWDERAALARQAGTAALAEPTVQRWLDQSARERLPEQTKHLLDMVKATSVDGFVGCANAIRDLAHVELVRAIRVPTLVLTGTKDQATPPALSEMLGDSIPGAAMVQLDAGHQSAVEAPQAFVQAWSRFVANMER